MGLSPYEGPWNSSQGCLQVWNLSGVILFKGELNPKIKFVLFERTLKITFFFQFLIPLPCF